jgi:thiol-disulfide isomerase/thioredoxin
LAFDQENSVMVKTRFLRSCLAAIALMLAFVQPGHAQRNAPNFVGINQWLNSAPLTIGSLRGKVVLVNFWTFGCSNCVATLPHLVRLHAAYRDKGLVIVGVHTPEFPFERATGSVQAALKRHGIEYPVAQDNGFATWNAYGNRYWPAQYVLDKSGRIVFTHFGEGRYDDIERTVRQLLAAQG